MRFFLQSPPRDYRSLLALPVAMKASPLRGELDFLQVFVSSPAELKSELPRMKKHLAKTGMLWISWAKKSSPLFNGVTEDQVRDLALRSGLVDVKVCAVTEDWSGLKLMYRRADRD